MQYPSYLRIADPAVLDAWFQLEREAAPSPSLMGRPAARPRRAGLSLLLPVGAVLALALLAFTLAAGPLLAARHLHGALAAPEPAGLAELADWDQLRANLAARLLPPGAAPGYLGDLARQVATDRASAEALHHALRQPPGASLPLARPAAGGAWRLRLASPALGPVELTLLRRQGRWLLVDLALPDPADSADD